MIKDTCNPFNIIDQTLLWKSQMNNRAPSANFYPSEASVVYQDKYSDFEVGGGCLRKSWYRINGHTRKPANAKSEWTFRMGHNFENDVESVLTFLKKSFDEERLPANAIEWLESNPEGGTPFKWIDLLIEGDIIIEPEHKFFVDIHGCPIKGAIDFVAAAPGSPTGKTALELKSTYGYFSSREIFGNTRQVGMPKLSHLLQAFLYLVVFDVDGEYDPKMIGKDEDGKDAVLEESSPHRFDDAWIMYLLRDDIQRGSHYIQLHKENGNIYPKVNGEPMKFFGFNEMIERYKALKESLSTELPPPKDFMIEYPVQKIESYFTKGKLSKKKYSDWQKGVAVPGDWQCRFCDFAQDCKSDNR